MILFRIFISFLVVLIFAITAYQSYWNHHNAAKHRMVVETLAAQIVGKTPEGFHRKDAEEMCEAMILLNQGLLCPDVRSLPGYLDLIDDN